VLTDSEIVVRTADLVKEYGAESAPVVALRGVSIAVGRGERVALLGKSGSGKSTLLNLLGGLDRPTSGQVEVAGLDLAAMSAEARARHRGATIGMVFQAYNLIPWRTAAQNVELPMIFAGRPPRERRESAKRALESVGLGHRLDHRPFELSGGENQRVAIARALVNDPEVLLADEPTGNLDSDTAVEILDLLIAHLDARGTTMIMVTHDEELARRCVDRVLTMKDGQILT
jgi:predicted ABC-type transport system involved in lysophospholipase L1 biosynthesis ATPase subunit